MIWFISYIFIAVGMMVLISQASAALENDDILPPPDPKDCNSTGTKNDQLRLFYKYRGLYDFRRFHYEEAIEDFNKLSGTVVFVNYQDEVLHLKCPCGNIQGWKQYGQGIDKQKFDEQYRDSRSEEVNVKRPDPRNYYRTIECRGANGEHHYFNIFTRPAVQTDFPVSFTEDQRGNKTLFWRCYIRRNTGNRNCTQTPYSYAWVFPKKDNDPIRVRMEPGSDTKSQISIGSTEYPKDNNSEIDCYKTKPWHTCTRRKVESYITLSVNDANATLQAGTHECVVTDRNGLSSSFRYENLDPNQDTDVMKRIDGMKFGGFVHVHIRGFIYIIIPIIIIVVIFVLTVICVWFIGDNREEYEQQALEEAERRRFEQRRLTGEGDEVVENPPAEDNEGNEQEVVMMEQPEGEIPAPVAE